MAAGDEAMAPIAYLLRVASSAGEPLNPEVIRWAERALHCPLADHYGQTEVAMMINNHHALKHPVKPGAAGLPLPGLEMAIRHPIPKIDHVAELSALEAAGLLQCKTMGEQAKEIFRELTANDLSEGLDDGEAATIAYAVAHSAATVPVVDERKATRIFRKRWSDRVAIGTVALISNDRILTSLPQEHLREAVYPLRQRPIKQPDADRAIRPIRESGKAHAAGG